MKFRSQFAILPAIALGLAGCGGQTPDEAPEEVAQPDAQADEGAAQAMTAAIPANLLGAWEMNEARCDVRSDGRLEISPTQFLYHESVGEVLSVSVDEEWTTVTLSMTGEGQTWERSERFRTIDGGNTLESDGGGDLAEADFPRRTRCKG